MRGGAELFADEHAAEAIGIVTSGGFGPSANAPVAMGYIRDGHAVPGVRLHAELRGKRVSMSITALPFVAPRVKRG